MSTIPEVLVPFLSVQETIILPTSTLSSMYFVYGLYVSLFGTYIYMTGKRQQGDALYNGKLYISLTVTLFTLSTIDVAAYTRFYTVSSTVRFNAIRSQNYDPLVDYLAHDTAKTAVLSLVLLLPILLNITADCMLIHRCYLIWGSRKRVALPLIVASVLTNTLGIVCAIIMTIGASDSSVKSKYTLYMAGNIAEIPYHVGSIIVNFVVTLLTAGRIWWIHRQVRAHGIHTSDALINSVLRIILESGIIYPLSTTAGLIIVNTVTTTIPVNFTPMLDLSAGIAPTLIMVRAKLGKNVESLQDHVSDIRFTSQPALREIQTQVDQES